MSSAAEEMSDDSTMILCASCGIAGGDDITLKKCACYLVRYCSVKCQKDHRPQHKRECKKRIAELRDEMLFKQPESSHYGDCPICCLPLPIDTQKSTLMKECCSKRFCRGCDNANKKREAEGGLQHKCPFCRETFPNSEEEYNERWLKRIEVNDPVAMCNMGTTRYHKGDYKSAIEYWTRAADLGDAEAHYQLSTRYFDGKGVEKDEKRERHHLTEAAIGGHPAARHNLGCTEAENGRMDKAVKHWIIAATLGYDDSLEYVKLAYKNGYASKDDFAAALRGHHAAIAATKSPQRDKEEALREKAETFSKLLRSATNSPQREEACAFYKWLDAERRSDCRINANILSLLHNQR